MVPRLVRKAVVSSWALSLAALIASEPTLARPDETDDHRVGIRGASRGPSRVLNGNKGGGAAERLIVRDGILFQTEGCPQVISEEQALTQRTDDSIPGNVIDLVSEGKGRAGNHFLTISGYLAMAYCCKTKVLAMPRFDNTLPSAVSGSDGRFETEKHFFDFSRVDMLPLEEFEGLSENPLVCEPEFKQNGADAFHLANIHEDLLRCMNRVYVRGCEATYLEPLLGTEKFGFCSKPSATHGRRLSPEDPSHPGAVGVPSTDEALRGAGSAGTAAAVAAGSPSLMTMSSEEFDGTTDDEFYIVERPHEGTGIDAAVRQEAVPVARARLREEAGGSATAGSPLMTMSSEFDSTDDEFHIVERPHEGVGIDAAVRQETVPDARERLGAEAAGSATAGSPSMTMSSFLDSTDDEFYIVEKPREGLITAAAHQEAVLDARRRLLGEHAQGSATAGAAPFLTMSSEFDSTDDEFYTVQEGAATTSTNDAGSLVIHIRSGDIMRRRNPLENSRTNFLTYGQPPLQYYLRAIASQPWSDVTILTFSTSSEELNPTFAALEMMQKTGMLGPHVTTHKNRDLLTDVRAMLCADGLAISRSTLHFLTFAHTRAKHFFVPSACGPGYYARGKMARRGVKRKPNPNNTTLLCIENPDAEVYGVDWAVDEDAYSLYDSWDASDSQRLDMVLFDGVKGFTRCCAR